MNFFKLQKIIDFFLLIILVLLLPLHLSGVISYCQVMSNSMAPAINTDDWVISKPITVTECKHLKPSTSLNAKNGNIIVFKIDAKSFPNLPFQEDFIIHRVIANDTVNQVIATKGDNNSIVCEWEQKIPYQNIYHQHLFTIPWKCILVIKCFLIIYFIFSFVMLGYYFYLNKKLQL